MFRSRFIFWSENKFLSKNSIVWSSLQKCRYQFRRNFWPYQYSHITDCGYPLGNWKSPSPLLEIGTLIDKLPYSLMKLCLLESNFSIMFFERYEFLFHLYNSRNFSGNISSERSLLRTIYHDGTTHSWSWEGMYWDETSEFSRFSGNETIGWTCGDKRRSFEYICLKLLNEFESSQLIYCKEYYIRFWIFSEWFCISINYLYIRSCTFEPSGKSRSHFPFPTDNCDCFSIEGKCVFLLHIIIC